MTNGQQSRELVREMGGFEAYTMGVGTMIGAGIFVLPAIAAANAGPASMISFVIGGFVSLLAALSLSELATGMPRAGGSYYYVNRALGSFLGSIVGLGMWVGLMFATAFYMVGFGQYMTYFLGEVPVQYSALVMASGLAIVNYRGIKDASLLQDVIVVLLLGLIVTFVALGVFHVEPASFQPFNPKGWGSVASMAATLYVSFVGFEVIATSAEEIKQPGRNLPVAMIASVLTPMILYVLVMFVAIGVLPISELENSQVPVAAVAFEFMGETGSLMLVLGAILATVSSANASILSAARVNFAMGRDKILTEWLTEVHGRFHTPSRAIVVTCGIIFVMIGVGVGIEILADVASFSFLVTYALVHVAVIVMRRADPPDYEPDFRLSAPWYPAVPLLGVATTLAITATMRPLVLAIGGGVVGLGVVWFFGYARRRSSEVSMIGEAIVGHHEQIGGAKRGFRLVVPVKRPKAERTLLRLAATCARTHDDPELVVVNVLEVPMQLALTQELECERKRVQRQQEVLDVVSELGEQYEVRVRTRGLVARRMSEAVAGVIEQERADRLMLGWRVKSKRHSHIFGSNVDDLVRRTSCEVSLVKVRGDRIGRVVALIGPGPTSPLVVRQAWEVASSFSESELTLLNVQPSSVEEFDTPHQAGESVIDKVVERAGLSEAEFDSRVLVEDDLVAGLLEAADEYQTVFIGATREGVFSQALFGSLPERIGKAASGNVVMVNKQYRPRTVWGAIRERLLTD